MGNADNITYRYHSTTDAENVHELPTKYTEFTWHCGYKVTHDMSLQHTRIRSCPSDKCVVSVHPLSNVELLALFVFVLFSFVRPNVSKKPEKFCRPLLDLEVQ